MLIKPLIGNRSQFSLEFILIAWVEPFTPVPFEEATQNVVKQCARVNLLEVEGRLAARFQLQHPLRKKPVRTIAIDTQTTGTVYEVGSELLLQQTNQIRVGDFTIVRAKMRTGAFTRNCNSTQRRFTQKAVIARESKQSFDAWEW